MFHVNLFYTLYCFCKKIPDRIGYCIKMVPVCMVHVCSSGGATLIIG